MAEIPPDGKQNTANKNITSSKASFEKDFDHEAGSKIARTTKIYQVGEDTMEKHIDAVLTLDILKVLHDIFGYDTVKAADNYVVKRYGTSIFDDMIIRKPKLLLIALESLIPDLSDEIFTVLNVYLSAKYGILDSGNFSRIGSKGFTGLIATIRKTYMSKVILTTA